MVRKKNDVEEKKNRFLIYGLDFKQLQFIILLFHIPKNGFSKSSFSR
jgi:hypothetical protein